MYNFYINLFPQQVLIKLPENPFNGSYSTEVLANEEAFPTEATGSYGWIYKPAIKEIRLDWPGTDSEGIAYFDY